MDIQLIGDYPFNDNFELPDKVKEICGGTATVFMGDTRVSTNVYFTAYDPIRNAQGETILPEP